jgi:hypothetical protein
MIFDNAKIIVFWRVPKKRCRTLPAEGLGVFPQTKTSPKIGGLRGLNTTFSAFCFEGNHIDRRRKTDYDDTVWVPVL